MNSNRRDQPKRGCVWRRLLLSIPTMFIMGAGGVTCSCVPVNSWFHYTCARCKGVFTPHSITDQLLSLPHTPHSSPPPSLSSLLPHTPHSSPPPSLSSLLPSSLTLLIPPLLPHTPHFLPPSHSSLLPSSLTLLTPPLLPHSPHSSPPPSHSSLLPSSLTLLTSSLPTLLIPPSLHSSLSPSLSPLSLHSSPQFCVQETTVVLVVTGVSVMLLDSKSLSLKYQVELKHLDQISVSSFSDHIFIMHINPVSLL